MVGSSDERTMRAQRKVGRVLGEKWRLDRLIGMGGMAAVYAATHTNNQRAAAIKVLHRELSAKEDLRKRFLREGYIANKVGHPGAITILDDGADEDGSVFLVMELFHGDTLHAMAKDAGGTLPALEVLRVTDKLLDVLAAAHEHGVVHRDLKPENIFVTRDGEVKVLDFGIARLLDARGDMTTQAGVLVGTPTYMPPEQIAGKMDAIDGRTDLWSVGAMMFTLLSGKIVHEAKAQNALLLAAMTAPARKIAEVLPEVSPAVARVVDRALEFDRENRWPDARAMQAAVREAIATGAPRAGAPKTGVDLERLVPPRPSFGRRVFGAFMALAVFSFAAALTVWVVRKRRLFSETDAEADASSPARAGAIDIADEASAPDAAEESSDATAEDATSAATAEADAGDEASVDASADADDLCDDDAGCDEDEDDDAGYDEDEPLDGAIPTSPDAGARPARPPASPAHKPPTKKPPSRTHPTTRPPTRRRKRRPRW